MDIYRFPCGCEFVVVRAPIAQGALPLLHFDAYSIRPDCKATWNLLSRGLCKGVFQLESPLGKQWAKTLKPQEMEHMSALGALLRPGCLKAELKPGVTMTKLYCLRLNGDAPVNSFHPALDPILAPTYQVLVYQEQSMRIGRELAGFDLKEVDRLRKAIGKKDEKEMSAVGEMFLAKAKEKGIVPYEVAETVWGWIKKSGRYQFNKCIAGDTVLRRPNKRTKHGEWTITVEQMYRIRHDREYAKATDHEQLRRKWKRLGNYGKSLSLCPDGRIRPNTICDIQPAGRRPVYKIRLMNGATIRVTGNHKFPTPEGQLRADQLSVGMSLFVCGDYEPSDFRTINRFSDTTQEDIRERALGAINGCFGEANWAYTNGSFSQFTQNDKVIPRICFNCGAKDDIARLELHHADGNRADSSIGNLVRLCSSCHKKEQYKMGRTRRGEKGYSATRVQIESIILEGVTETFDVTMSAPNHTFVVDTGIVTCNSHSLSYGIIGYITAYIKTHFPVQFFWSWLRYAQEKSEPMVEIAELVNDAKLFDVPILPPDVRTLKKRFSTNGVEVCFGLSDINGIGPSQIVKIRDAAAKAKEELGKSIGEWNWFETLNSFASNVPANVMEKLISVGGFDYLGKGLRTRHLAEFKLWDFLTKTERNWICSRRHQFESLLPAVKALALPRKPSASKRKKGEPEPTGPFGGCATDKRQQAVASQVLLLENPPSPLDDLPNWVARTEAELLGVALTCSEVDSLDQRDVNTTCKEYHDGSNGHYGTVILGVKIENMRTIVCKRGKSAGKKMAYLTISDGSCALADVVVFSDAYAAHQDVLVENNCVILCGQRDRKSDQFIVKKACLM